MNVAIALTTICQRDAARSCCWAPAPAARRPQLSIDIACPQGAQPHSLAAIAAVDQRDSQTDGQTDGLSTVT